MRPPGIARRARVPAPSMPPRALANLRPMTSIESLRGALRPGESLPIELEQLAAYAASAGGAFAGDFELIANGEEALVAWFAGRAKPASAFFAFAHDGTGGLFAIWRRRETLDASPVVFLGSEGETIVLSSTPREFLGLLAYGVGDLGFVDWEEEPPVPSDEPGAVAFRAWLRKTLGVEPHAEPAPIVLAARERHSGLEAWVMAAIA